MGATNINDIYRNHTNAGKHFFSDGALQFFDSKVLSDVFEGPGGVYFVTSEKCPFTENSIRRYTCRKYCPETHNITTVGEFNVLTKPKALKLARESALG